MRTPGKVRYQNIPIPPTEEGSQILEALRAGRKGKLPQIDYKDLELRILPRLGGDNEE